MSTTEATTEQTTTFKGEDITPEKDGGLFEKFHLNNSIAYFFSQQVFSKK
jgi:hypothetical protein